MTGEEVLVLLHSEQEVCHFLNAGLVGFALAVQIRICVYGDLGVFLDAVDKIFECGVVLKIVNLSRYTTDQKFGFIAVVS